MTKSEKRLAEGKCKFCDNPLKTTRLCKEHAAKASSIQSKVFKKRKDAGNCGSCGDPRGSNGTKSLCNICAMRLRTQVLVIRERRKQAGICLRCPEKIAEGKSTIFCEGCLEKHRNSNRKKK